MNRLTSIVPALLLVVAGPASAAVLDDAGLPSDDGGFLDGPEPDPSSIRAFDTDGGGPSAPTAATKLTLSQAVQRLLP